MITLTALINSCLYCFINSDSFENKENFDKLMRVHSQIKLLTYIFLFIQLALVISSVMLLGFYLPAFYTPLFLLGLCLCTYISIDFICSIKSLEKAYINFIINFNQIQEEKKQINHNLN